METYAMVQVNSLSNCLFSELLDRPWTGNKPYIYIPHKAIKAYSQYNFYSVKTDTIGRSLAEDSPSIPSKASGQRLIEPDIEVSIRLMKYL